MPKDRDVKHTRKAREFVYIHAHIVDKDARVHCRWIGLCDHSGKPQIFRDASYAHAFRKEGIIDTVYELSITLQNAPVVDVTLVDATSSTLLSAAMRKVLRV